ncbi:MAG: hypothetical protein JKY67_00355 [Pseudomonadales bacterium]|nr:hypothetical protein [Pseudomonadales bacterium]
MIRGLLKEIIAEELGATLSKSNKPESNSQFSGRMIVVLDKGFIYFGDIEIVGDTIVGRNGGNIRYYSEPDGGLARLTSHQPSEKTKIDPCKKWVAPFNLVKNAIDIQEGGI